MVTCVCAGRNWRDWASVWLVSVEAAAAAVAALK